jgi:hypothetical protein
MLCQILCCCLSSQVIPWIFLRRSS